jgi:hypothetical protein
MKGCSRIDLIRLGEHAIYNNLAKSKLLIVRSGFYRNRARASRDLGRASARYKLYHKNRKLRKENDFFIKYQPNNLYSPTI